MWHLRVRVTTQIRNPADILLHEAATGPNATPEDLRSYLRYINAYITKLAPFKDKQRIAQRTEYAEQLEEMQRTVLKDDPTIASTSMYAFNVSSMLF